MKTSSLLMDTIAQWLLTAAVQDADYGAIVGGLGHRLLKAGMGVHRVTIGGVIVHPVIGARDAVWEAESDNIRFDVLSRRDLLSPAVQNSPFFNLASKNERFYRTRLDAPDYVPGYPILAGLRGKGYTDYFATFMSFCRKRVSHSIDLPVGIEGALASFATRRIGGFTGDEIASLTLLSLPLAMAIKSATMNDFALTLIRTYVGHYTGEQVFNGRIERGDANVTQCVIWYCDLRDCSGLAHKLPREQYLSMLNDYFDCTAGAIIDHGGEVLKFIGDAVLAIFPIEAPDRPAAEMCRAAVLATREALLRARGLNAQRTHDGLPAIDFGTALHVGEVMYGNVGTRRRMDFTVIGTAVNDVSRLEKSCKMLRKCVVASDDFCTIAALTDQATPFDMDPALGVSFARGYVLDGFFDSGVIAS